MNSRGEWIFALILFLSVLLIYLLTASPTLAPYRDAGELTLSADTLGIAHSPGYPLYMLTGKTATAMGRIFGMSAARSMNCLSSLFGAASALLFFLIVLDLTKDSFLAFISAFTAALMYMTWYLSIVSEMYSFNLLLNMFMLMMYFRRKYMLLFFIAGLCLGNHLTSVLSVILIAAFVFYRKEYRKEIFRYAAVFLLGFSVYLYLPLRSSGGPFLNWGAPESFSSFMKVLSREAYGHSLDLVSRTVSLREVYVPHLKHLAGYLAGEYTPPLFGITVLVILGAFVKRFSEIRLLPALLFLLSGPFFLLMAKMPVNPHSLAIVEVSYVLSEAMYLLLFTVSLAFLFFGKEKARIRALVIIMFSALGIFLGIKNYRVLDMSDNRLAYCYASDMDKSLNPDSVLIMRRDHPLFSLWYFQYTGECLNNIIIISKGLMSAQWYREKIKEDYPDFELPEIFTDDESFIAAIISDSLKTGRDIFMTPAVLAELSEKFRNRYLFKPNGLAFIYQKPEYVYKRPEVLSGLMEGFRIRSCKRGYMGYSDFFSRDFLNIYSSSYCDLASEFIRDGKYSAARPLYSKAVAMCPENSGAYSGLAYIFMREGNYGRAVYFYSRAVDVFEKRIRNLTRKERYFKDLARIVSNRGAAYEKLYRKTGDTGYFHKAEKDYFSSIRYDPGYSMSYYNLAVLYWGKDWLKTVNYLKKAQGMDPANTKIKTYLSRAKSYLDKDI